MPTDFPQNIQKRESKLGSNCSGTDGTTGRVLTLTNTGKSAHEEVIVDKLYLTPTTDYTVSHLSASSTITFLVAIYDAQTIVVRYEVKAV